MFHNLAYFLPVGKRNRADPTMPGILMKELVLRDGGSIVYRDVGRGRPIVLLHGWGVSSALFELQFHALAKEFRLLAPDFRGHGGSSAFTSDHGFSRLADDIAEWMDHLALDGVVVVGWSMGAMVAWDLLFRRRVARVSGLVIVDMVPRLLNDEKWNFGLRRGRDAQVFERSLQAMRHDWSQFTRVFVPRIFARRDHPRRLDEIDRVCATATVNDPESMARLWASLVNQDFRAQLGKMNLPALVMGGTDSQLYSMDASRWVAAAMPAARLELLEHAGHAPQLEQPDAFNRSLAKFVRQFDSQSAADHIASAQAGNN